MRLHNPLQNLFELIAPHACLRCGVEGSQLCGKCRLDTCLPLPDRCYRCFRASPDSAVCPACRPHSQLDHVWVATDYDLLARRLVRAFKFERAQAADEVLAFFLDNVLPYLPEVLVTHVPSATSRVRQRGYEHTKLLADRLAARRKLRRATLLARHGQARQVGAQRSARLQQLRHAFRPLNRVRIHGAHILIIDDVVTTGGTIEAAAAALKRDGAAHVDALVFAQKQ